MSVWNDFCWSLYSFHGNRFFYFSFLPKVPRSYHRHCCNQQQSNLRQRNHWLDSIDNAGHLIVSLASLLSVRYRFRCMMPWLNIYSCATWFFSITIGWLLGLYLSANLACRLSVRKSTICQPWCRFCLNPSGHRRISLRCSLKWQHRWVRLRYISYSTFTVWNSDLVNSWTYILCRLLFDKTKTYLLLIWSISFYNLRQLESPLDFYV